MFHCVLLYPTQYLQVYFWCIIRSCVLDMQIIPASYCAGIMGGLQPFEDSYFDTLF